jgi:hypothetical protein
MAEVQDEVSEMSAGFDAEAPEAPVTEPMQPEEKEETKPEPAPAAPAVEGPKYVRPLAEVFDTFVAVRSQAERALTAPAAGAGAAEAKNAGGEPSNG